MKTNKAMRHFHRQRGSVLLTVLLVMLLASIMVAALQRSQSHETRHTLKFLRTVQAWHYALGAETYTRQLLYVSYDPTTLADYPAQVWGKPVAAFTLPEGHLTLRIVDLQARFNLNSLAQAGDQPLTIFSQLLAQSAVDPKHAQAVVLALQSMAASTNQTAAADQSACGGTPLFSDASQLIDAGLGVDDFQKIASSVTVLPDTCLDFNINTVGPRIENIIVSNATKRSAVDQLKEQQGYLSANDVARLGLGAGITSDSHYFEAQIGIRDEFGTYALSSVINRRVDDNHQVVVKTVSRDWQSCPECVR